MQKTHGKTVLVVCAHDDDSILGVGSQILRHLSSGDKVHVVICHDGRTSHRAVFQREERPSLAEVGAMRRREIAEAMQIMGVNNFEVLSLSGEEARPSQNFTELEQELHKRIVAIGPNEIYFHLADAHPDHQAVAETIFRIMEKYPKDFLPDVRTSQFMIWVRELAELQGQSNMNATQAPPISDDALLCGIPKEHLPIKRRALHCMRSQVQTWPYPEWDPQSKAVLSDIFLRYFLAREIIVPVNWTAG